MGSLGKSWGQKNYIYIKKIIFFKKKDKEKKRKPTKLKTQKGGLSKSYGQRKEKKGKSHQVGNLKMQPKKKRILQDESLEI